MKLINFLRKLFGFTYIVNENTKEIHDTKNKHHNCHLEVIYQKHFITKQTAYKLIESGYNGCRWCMKEFDKG